MMKMDQKSKIDERYAADELVEFAIKLLSATGLGDEKARIVATMLVEGDLLDHNTHGLALLPSYLDELSKALMSCDGEIEVLSDNGATTTWDGKRVPGPWLISKPSNNALQEQRSTELQPRS